MRKQIMIIAAAVLTAALGAQAATYTWTQGNGTGNANQIWGLSANWVGSPTLTFTNTTDLIFDDASVVNKANAIAINGNRMIRSLTINANYNTANNATFDIQPFQTINTTPRTLTFAANSGNASINVAQSTSGIEQVRLGNNTGGNVILNSNLDIAQNNTFFNAAGLLFDGVVSGAGAINKTGAGVVSFNRNNPNWSGGMNINEGTVQVLSNPGAMGTGAWTLGGGANNTTFLLGSTQVFSNSSGLVVAAGAGTRTIANTGLIPASGVGNPTFSGNITLSNDATFAITQYTAGTHDRLTAQGAISGTGGINKTGAGILQLNGTNTYSGRTTVESGTLTLKANQAVGDESELILAASASLVLDFAGTETVKTLSLDGGITFLAPGTYTAAQLMALGSGIYSGSGSVNVLQWSSRLKLIILH